MHFIFRVLFLCCIYNAANAQSPESIAKIDNLRIQMQELAKENKLLAVAEFYADNAVVNGPDAKLSGKKEIQNYWSQIRGTGENWRWEIKCVSGSDALIYQTGISYLTLKYGDISKTYTANFCVAWEKQENEMYKIIADIYH